MTVMKVAIIGHGNGWQQGFACKPEGFEIWCLNDIRPGYDMLDADRWFQLHTLDYLEKNWPPWAGMRELWRSHWQSGGKTPLYMHRAYPELPGSVAFPKEAIELNLPRGQYHCGSFDWMVAFAILLRATEIRLYGIMLTHNGEPLSARACLEYWLGIAEGKGIKTEVVSNDLFYTFQLLRSQRQYGWDESRPIAVLEETNGIGDALLR